MKEKPENLLPALRSLIVHELHRQYRIKRSEIARALGVSPASVSQYLSKSRGVAMVEDVKRNPMAMQMVKVFADSIAQRVKAGIPIDVRTELSELSLQMFRLLKGELQRPSTGEGKEELMKFLLDRVRLEEVAARKALEIASKSGDELLRNVLRQIATDSLRHAEIINLVIKNLDKETDTQSKFELDMLSELAAYESSAEGSGLEELIKRVKNAALKALLISVEMDEKKHQAMLDELLGRGKEKNS